MALNGALNGALNEALNISLNGVNSINDAVNIVCNALNKILFGALNDALNKRMINEIIFLYERNRCKLQDIVDEFNIKRVQAQRDIARLKKVQLIIYVGCKKTGFYKLSDQIISKLNEIKEKP